LASRPKLALIANADTIRVAEGVTMGMQIAMEMNMDI
jgi:hypothetical protein